MLEVGVRVVRGPDWRWGAQDGGEGHVGTVVEIGRNGSLTSPDKTVVVLWDSGTRTNYRVGYTDAYDLRVVDNAPVGVKHPNIICDGCRCHGIVGMRWKCVRCYDYDLCTQCYMGDQHDTGHFFQRFETASSVGVDMLPRKGCSKVELKGIFIGAKVVRGPDWDWGNQDGGDGKIGTVLDIRGWDNESGRSVANVAWTSGSTNVYRLGHKGKVDLKCFQEVSGGFYYREHLPVLGHNIENHVGSRAAANNPSQGTRCLTFNVGDKVQVLMDVETLKHMQEGHGGWNPRMAEYIGAVGTVHRVTDRGDIRVQYEGCNNRWTFHPGALTKTNTFSLGDIVRVKMDIAKVKEYQKGHGEWSDAMKGSLGKMGKVIKIYPDGDLRVCVDGQTWTLNPLSVSLLPGSATELNNTMTNPDGQRQDHANPLDSLFTLEDQGGSLERLVREAAEGHLETVKDFISKYPEKVDSKSGGKTCLHVTCHQGHSNIVQLLLNSGASLELQDDEGDTALHYSAFGNQPEIIELLLHRGANIDAVNKGQCTALHVAVNKQHTMCVAALVKRRCNVNIQDLYGDTALHDAISKESTEIIELLCGVPAIDFTLKNARGFNVLHHAALKGNNFATERLLARARQMVDVKKDDGFAALHLACLNGHRAVAETLLSQGQADVGLRNNRRQTPLLLAVAQGHSSIVELVVSMNGDVNADDEIGDTSLHLALMKRASISSEINELEAPTIYGIFSQLQSRTDSCLVALAIACYLVQEGCSLTKKNRRGVSPLDLVADTPIAEILQQYNLQTHIPPQIAAPLKRQKSTLNSAGLHEKLAAITVTSSASGDEASTSDSNENCEPCPEAPVLDSPSSSNGIKHPAPPPVECCVCSELGEENVKFEPCGHRVACEECASRVKKCLKCGSSVKKRVTQDGRIVICKSRQHSTERLRYLESKIAEIEEAHCCSICMERKRNVAFLCGHGACDKCSATLSTCHMCRKSITRKINLY